MGGLLALSRGIDAVTAFIGRHVIWLILAAILVSAGNAVIRKTFDMMPPPLGITMHERGNDYDTSPPEAPEGAEGRPAAEGGPNHSKVLRCQEWLYALLDSEGSVRVSEVRRRAEAEGHSSKTLYTAKDRLNVNEFDLDGKKYWQLIADDGPAF